MTRFAMVPGAEATTITGRRTPALGERGDRSVGDRLATNLDAGTVEVANGTHG